MENSKYNSLTDKLIQNGIIQSSNEPIEQNQSDNFFESMKSEIIPDENSMLEITDTKEDIENLKNLENYKKETINNISNKKRINEYDLDLIRNVGVKTYSKKHQNPFETIKRFVDFKQNKVNKGYCGIFEIFLCRFFPKIYRAKLIKKAISKMLELNIDTKTLLDKRIPYGESDSRYEDLIKYLNYANELQTKLKKSFS